MATKNVSKPSGDEQRLLTIQQGIQAIIPATSSMMVGGQSFTRPQLLTEVAQLLAPFQPVRDAKKALAQAVAAKKQNQPAVKSFLAEFRAAMIALFGRGSPTLADFGIEPRKAKATTAGAKVVRAAKAKATRQLLGTKGPVQKAEVLAQARNPEVSVSATGAILPPAGAGEVPASASAAEAAASLNGSTAGSAGSGK